MKTLKLYAHPYTLFLHILKYEIDIPNNKGEDTVKNIFFKNQTTCNI